LKSRVCFGQSFVRMPQAFSRTARAVAEPRLLVALIDVPVDHLRSVWYRCCRHCGNRDRLQLALRGALSVAYRFLSVLVRAGCRHSLASYLYVYGSYRARAQGKALRVFLN